MTDDAEVVLEAATSLTHILQIASSPTLKALDKHDAVTVLAYVIKRQQQLEDTEVHSVTIFLRFDQLHDYCVSTPHTALQHAPVQRLTGQEAACLCACYC